MTRTLGPYLILNEQNKPVEWCCFGLDDNENKVSVYTSLYGGEQGVQWQPRAFDATPFSVFYVYDPLTTLAQCYLCKQGKLYQIPKLAGDVVSRINEPSLGKEEISWPLTNEPIKAREFGIDPRKYNRLSESDQAIISELIPALPIELRTPAPSPVTIITHSAFSIDQAKDLLNPTQCHRVQGEVSADTLSPGTMNVWKDEAKNWHYQTLFLDQMQLGTFDSTLDKDVIASLEQLQPEQVVDKASHVAFERMFNTIMRPYLTLSQAQQTMIVAALHDMWPLSSEFTQEEQKQLCVALVSKKRLSDKLGVAVDDFRKLLISSELAELTGPADKFYPSSSEQPGYTTTIADIWRYVNFLLMAAARALGEPNTLALSAPPNDSHVRTDNYEFPYGRHQVVYGGLTALGDELYDLVLRYADQGMEGFSPEQLGIYKKYLEGMIEQTRLQHHDEINLVSIVMADLLVSIAATRGVSSTDAKQLLNEQCIHTLNQIIKSQVLQRLDQLNNEESTDEIWIGIIENKTQFFQALRLLDQDGKDRLLNAFQQSKLIDEIDNPIDLAILFNELPETMQRMRLLTLFKPIIIHIIQNNNQHLSTLLKSLQNQTEKSMLLGMLDAPISDYVDSIQQFSTISDSLYEMVRTRFREACDSKLPLLIQNGDDLDLVFKRSSTRQINLLLTVFKNQKINIASFIQNIDQFVTIHDALPTKGDQIQFREACNEQLLSWLQQAQHSDWYHQIEPVLKRSSSDQKTEILNALEPRFPALITSTAYILSAHFSISDSEFIINSLGDGFLNLLKTPSDYLSMLQCLSSKQRTYFVPLMNSKIVEMVKDLYLLQHVTSSNYNIQKLSTAEHQDLIAKFLVRFTPEMLTEFNSFLNLFESLSIEQKEYVLDRLSVNDLTRLGCVTYLDLFLKELPTIDQQRNFINRLDVVITESDLSRFEAILANISPDLYPDYIKRVDKKFLYTLLGDGDRIANFKQYLRFLRKEGVFNVFIREAKKDLEKNIDAKQFIYLLSQSEKNQRRYVNPWNFELSQDQIIDIVKRLGYHDIAENIQTATELSLLLGKFPSSESLSLLKEFNVEKLLSLSLGGVDDLIDFFNTLSQLKKADLKPAFIEKISSLIENAEQVSKLNQLPTDMQQAIKQQLRAQDKSPLPEEQRPSAKNLESQDETTNTQLHSALINSSTHFRSAVNNIKNVQSSFSKEQLERIDRIAGKLTQESSTCVTNASKQLKTEKISALKLLKTLSFTHDAASSIQKINDLPNIDRIRSGRSCRVSSLLDELKSESLTQVMGK